MKPWQQLLVAASAVAIFIGSLWLFLAAAEYWFPVKPKTTTCTIKQEVFDNQHIIHETCVTS